VFIGEESSLAREWRKRPAAFLGVLIRIRRSAGEARPGVTIVGNAWDMGRGCSPLCSYLAMALGGLPCALVRCRSFRLDA